METIGRQRTHSISNVTFPASSTFRRLPNLGRSPFRRGDKASSPSPEANVSPSKDISSHQRVSTFPSLSKLLVDDKSASNYFFQTPNSTPLASSTGQFSESDDNDPSPSTRLQPPSRTSSLRQTPSPQPSSETSSLLPSMPARTSRETMNTLSPPQPVSSFFNDLEPITYPAHLAQVKPPDPAAIGASPDVRPTIRQRDLTMGSGATILLGAVHTPPSRNEPGLGGPPMGVPKRKESISGPHDRGVTPTEDGGRSNSRALNIVLSQGKGEGSTGSYVAPEASMSNERIGSKSYKDGEVESGGEVNGQRRRATTRPSAGASQVGATETRGEMPANHERERSRKSSAKQPRSAIKITEPLLPSAKGVSRAPASAMYFSLLPSHGRPPAQALRAHTGTLVGDRIWFLGGVDGRMCWRSVAWLDTESLLWSTVDTNGEQLPPLRAHTTTLVGELLYIFGGGDGPTYSNDVWIFNTVTHRFTRATIATPRSSLPPPRRAHTTVVYRNFLVVFGGGNGQAALNDVWALDVSDPDRLTWHEWRTKGDVPQKKGYHTANLIGDKMIVFGGSDGHASFADVHVLNLQSFDWTLVSTEVKYNRLSHTSTQVGSYLFIIGGHNGQTYAQDVLLLNLVTLQWESKIPRGIAPPGRGYHVALLHDARIFISGGYNGVSVFEDLWVLDLSAGAYLPQVTTFKIDEGASRAHSEVIV